MIAPQELERVYTEHGPSLFAYLLNLTRSESASHDLLHELFLKLARRSSLRWRLVHRQRPYLLRAAYRLFVDWHRREQARALTLAGFAHEAPLFAPAGNDTGELAAQAAAWLDGLPPEQRAVVHLKIWEQLTFREIGKTLAISANTAASRYRYALDKLRDRQRQPPEAHD
jgi:RNA polymerase sigma-70 factor (ECF subfamily)